MTQMQAPQAGWYPASDDPGVFCWWDGTRWTEHRSGPYSPPAPSQPQQLPVTGPATASSGELPRWILPTGRSALAIAAGYLGLFSVLLVVAPVSLVVGALALRDLRRRPGVLGRGRAIFGVVTGALFSILLLVLLLLRA